jgi:hypothetical protein
MLMLLFCVGHLVSLAGHNSLEHPYIPGKVIENTFSGLLDQFLEIGTNCAW